MFNIWVIDDDTETTQDVIDFWEKVTEDYPFRFRLFPTAKQALDTLWSVPIKGKSAPHAIIIDGHLHRDEPSLSYGTTVIREIIGASGNQAPLLIAWSADPYAEEDMMHAGAHASFGKMQRRELIGYLQSKYRELQR